MFVCMIFRPVGLQEFLILLFGACLAGAEPLLATSREDEDLVFRVIADFLPKLAPCVMHRVPARSVHSDRTASRMHLQLDDPLVSANVKVVGILRSVLIELRSFDEAADTSLPFLERL